MLIFKIISLGSFCERHGYNKRINFEKRDPAGKLHKSRFISQCLLKQVKRDRNFKSAM
jgi:hypothetical protein